MLNSKWIGEISKCQMQWDCHVSTAGWQPNIFISLAEKKPWQKNLRKKTFEIILFFTPRSVILHSAIFDAKILFYRLWHKQSLPYLLKSCQLLVPSAPKYRCPWIGMSSSSHVCMSRLPNFNLLELCLQSSYGGRLGIWCTELQLGGKQALFLSGRNNTFHKKFHSLLFICVSYLCVTWW